MDFHWAGILLTVTVVLRAVTLAHEIFANSIK